ncbi:FxLYD domain-containing protein [Micromonospora sp. NPDC000207]|uniref:FxLYD domain-containing protein n=1 Tax=Micromonospora sp. NPDC000207 TaxID=3154246 RepID=UPI003330B8C7
MTTLPPPGSPPPAHPYPPQYHPTPPPPRPTSWAKSTAGILTLTGIGCLALTMLICGGVIAAGAAMDRRGLDDIDAQLTACEISTIGIGKIGYTVTNNGSAARRVSLKLEYRDATGARVDTDTARVGEVPAGDTVRGEETTILNATPTGTVECKIVGIS